MHELKTSSKRRIDIDLLRAVAVLAVIFFHFEIPGFGGGFLGVDIFFVLSGYLMTLHINQELDQNRFSFKRFYLRRIRRLAPAFIATLLLTSIGAILILPQDLLADFSRSQVASALYVSNFYFWSIADYFDTASYFKPLLHTWSLAIEEQFYLFWPFFLFLTRFLRQRSCVLLLGLFSLLAVEIVYDSSPSAAFYMFPFRIFEFSAGAAVSYKPLCRLSRWPRTGLLLASIAILFASILLSDEGTRLPGFLALPICVATALIIWVRHPAINSRNPMTSLLSRIGLASYSSYLLHWPLVVYFKLHYSLEISLLEAAMLVVFTLLLAEVFYRLVEQPTARIDLNRRGYLLVGSVPILVISAIVFLHTAIGVQGHLSPNHETVQSIIDNTPKRKAIIEKLMPSYRAQLKNKDRKTILVVGDSHSQDVAWALLKPDILDRFRIRIVHSRCDPLTARSIPLDLNTLYETNPPINLNEKECERYHESLLENLEQYSPYLVIFSERWRAEALPYLGDSIRDIQAAMDTKILILGRNFDLTHHPRISLRKLQSALEINHTAMEDERDLSHIEQALLGIAAEAQVPFISKRTLVCPRGRCEVFLNGKLNYDDKSHWTEPGLALFGQRLVDHPVFRSALEEAESSEPE